MFSKRVLEILSVVSILAGIGVVAYAQDKTQALSPECDTWPKWERAYCQTGLKRTLIVPNPGGFKVSPNAIVRLTFRPRAGLLEVNVAMAKYSSDGRDLPNCYKLVIAPEVATCEIPASELGPITLLNLTIELRADGVANTYSPPASEIKMEVIDGEIVTPVYDVEYQARYSRKNDGPLAGPGRYHPLNNNAASESVSLIVQ